MHVSLGTPATGEQRGLAAGERCTVGIDCNVSEMRVLEFRELFAQNDCNPEKHYAKRKCYAQDRQMGKELTTVRWPQMDGVGPIPPDCCTLRVLKVTQNLATQGSRKPFKGV